MRTVHERRRDFVCNICNTALSTRSVLAKHKRNVHDDYVCWLCRFLPDFPRFSLSLCAFFCFSGRPSRCQRTCLLVDSFLVPGGFTQRLFLTRARLSCVCRPRYLLACSVVVAFLLYHLGLSIPHRGHTRAPCASFASPSGAIWSATLVAPTRQVPPRRGGPPPMGLATRPAAPTPTLPRCCLAPLAPVACHRLPRLLGCTERRRAHAGMFRFFLSLRLRLHTDFVLFARRVVRMCISWGLGRSSLFLFSLPAGCDPGGILRSTSSRREGFARC